MGERTGYVELFVAAAVKNEVQLQNVPRLVEMSCTLGVFLL